MIWVSGTDKACTFFNQGWLAFTGRTMHQELGEGWAASVHPLDLDRCLDIYSSSFDARRSFQMEYRLRRADGEYRWLLDSGVPRFEPGGTFAGYIGSCIDITDLKRAQEESLAMQKLDSVAPYRRHCPRPITSWGCARSRNWDWWACRRFHTPAGVGEHPRRRDPRLSGS
jgi:PAS domain S-box-containing protein